MIPLDPAVVVDQGTRSRQPPRWGAIRRILSLPLAVLLATALAAGQEKPRGGGVESIQARDLETWLTYIASDALEGRQVYTEGLGLAAAYIADHLAAWGVRPAMPDGSYFQPVKVTSVRNDSKSSVTLDAGGQRRTFADGAGVTLPRNAGGAQTVAGSDLVFVGYGLQLPDAGLDDYAGLDVRGKIVVWLGQEGPAAAGTNIARALATRSRLALEKGAIAVVGPPSGFGARPGAPSAGAKPQADFTTVQRYDLPIPPIVGADEAFLELLFTGAEVPYRTLAGQAGRREPLPRFTLKGVKLTIDVAPGYTVVGTRLSRNVVGIVQGSDPALAATYVAFGAHYDHIGYRPVPPAAGGAGGDAGGCAGQTRRDPKPGDSVFNGADDDGSGTVALMAIARAFAGGSKPRRSLVFVWHTAEESGLQGSRYNADYPVVPNESIVAQLNVDMIGRNRCDDPKQANTVYLVGSDRISTELHNLSEDANAALREPMILDYELNDPADPQSIYTRSDHYSYAVKGIPVIFYTTGLHRDYHALTDEVERIEFAKLTRVARLIFATGERLANAPRPPARDNKGPRTGKGTGGRLGQESGR